MNIQSAIPFLLLIVLGTALNEPTPDPHTTAHPTPPPPPPTRPPPSAPAWADCPPAFLGIYNDCANITVWEHWGDEANQKKVTFWLGRLHPTPINASAPPLATLWYLGDRCLIHSLDSWVTQFRVANAYVIDVHIRGSQFAYPSVQCPPSMQDSNGYPLPNCSEWLTHTMGDMTVYSYTEAALDIAFAVTHLNGPQRSIIVADGLATILAQRLQAVSPDTGDAFVLSGVTTPGVYDITAASLRYNTVARKVLSACSSSNDCISRFGGQDPWDLWVALMQSAQEGLLPCAAQLQWPVTSYHDALANMAAMLLQPSVDPDIVGNTITQSFFPSMIYRLQRCNNGDAKVLTKLYTTLNSLSSQGQGQESGLCLKSALPYHLMLSEMINGPPATAEDLVLRMSQLPVQPSTSLMTALANLLPTWPKYTVTAAQQAIGNSPKPTYVFAGDTDPILPMELARTAAVQYTKPHQMFVVATNGVHSLLNGNGATCLATAVIAVINNAQPAATCVVSPALDVIGTSLPVQTVVKYLGVADIWNVSQPSGGAVTNPPVPPGPPRPTPAPTPPPHQGGTPSDNSSDKGAAVALGILFAIALVILIAIGVVYYRRNSSGRPSSGSVQGDFYSQLRK